VIDLAKSENIKYIFYQEEFDSSQAETVAEEIGGQVIKVSPLSKSYIESLKDVGEKFKMK
jgi:zinc transport system substrate-binding protein